VFLMIFIGLSVCELLDDNKLTVCGHLWCITCQASRCHAATSADAWGSGSVMEVMHTNIVWGFKRAVSCDDTAEECGMYWE
jgi:hypothetical protein